VVRSLVLADTTAAYGPERKPMWDDRIRVAERSEMKEQIQKVVAEDRAEDVILACAGLCGYDTELSRLAGVPVLDPVTVGVKIAESIVALGVSHSKARKFAHPPQPLDHYL